MSGEPDVSDLLTVQRAIEVIDSTPVSPRAVRVPLAKARGLRLAEDLAADRDYPPFDKSLMDGYAVRAADVGTSPVALRIVGEVAAGHVASREVRPGEAMGIMTGAPLPAGADAVVPVEDVAVEGDRVRVLRTGGDPRRFVSRRTSDAAAGQPALARGTAMDAAQIAVAATIGAAEVLVYDRPRAAVLSTGDELVGVGETPSGSQIRNSNGPMLVALLDRLGCEATDLGVVRDDPKAIRAAMEAAIADHGVLFVSGGMSMGAYDYVPGLLREIGFDLRITKLRIKPGKPFVFGVREGSAFRVQGSATTNSAHLLNPEPRTLNPSYVFGLPGNPVSGFACTVRLASRLIARLAGGAPEERWVVGRLAAPVGPNGPREFYQPVGLDWRPDGVVVTPMTWRGSADLFTLAKARGLMVRPENDVPRAAGEAVRVLEV